MTSINEKFPSDIRPKDVLVEYEAARKRGDFYAYKREAASCPEKARSFADAGDEQADLQANFMGIITKNKAYDLADVHAKLVLLNDNFRSYFEKPDFVAQDQAKLLRDSIDWIETFLAFRHEKKPSAVEPVARDEKEQAA